MGRRLGMPGIDCVDRQTRINFLMRTLDAENSEPCGLSKRRGVMRYFWILLSLCACSRVQGSGGIVPKRLNDVYYWEQNTAASHVAEHAERKHTNHEEHSSTRLFGGWSVATLRGLSGRKPCVLPQSSSFAVDSDIFRVNLELGFGITGGDLDYISV
ncbi:epidermal growth factor-like protein 8 [Trichonephila clavipes]|nr:epidermal growth factor-like protein 8 [Trichonephila clavipes]